MKLKRDLKFTAFFKRLEILELFNTVKEGCGGGAKGRKTLP